MADAGADEALLSVLNKVLADFPVTSGYDILYGSPDSCYHYTSPDGYLKVESVSKDKAKELLATCSTRVFFSDDAAIMKIGDADAWENMALRRQIEVQGDGAQLRALQKDLETAVTRIQSLLDSEAQAANLMGFTEAKREFDQSDLQQRRAAFARMTPGIVPGVLVATKSKAGMDQMQIATYSDSYIQRTIGKILMFSAFSTVGGNVGQANYGAANILMERYAMASRQSRPALEDSCIMWGIVGGIGMRLKAFGSRDFGLEGGEHTYLTLGDCQKILRGMFSLESPPENVAALILDAMTKRAMGLVMKGDGPAVDIAAPKPEALYPTAPQSSVTLPSATKQAAHAKPESELDVPPLHCIAGNWDNWKAHAMEWDAERQCFIGQVCLGQKTSGEFQIVKGKASEGKTLKSTGVKMWLIRGKAWETYEVRCFLRPGTGSCRKVDWVRTGMSGPCA